MDFLNELKKAFYDIGRNILDLLYPPRCPACGEILCRGGDFCDECRKKLTPFEQSYTLEHCESCFSVWVYDDSIKEAVYTLKDRGGNAPEIFGKAMAELLIKHNIPEKADFIIPVPMYKSDERERGWNQMKLIAKEISYRTGMKVCSDIVEKSRKTAHQKNLSQEERMVNLKDAFTVKTPETVKGKNILIIDDVCTTGSTLSEIAAVLKKYGAGDIFCCTCCRAVLS